MMPVDWVAVESALRAARTNGGLAQASLRHGHTFLQLCDIRGYQALMFDMADGDPRLHRLIAMIEEFNLHVIDATLPIPDQQEQVRELIKPHLEYLLRQPGGSV